jgi:hypothetical protein
MSVGRFLSPRPGRPRAAVGLSALLLCALTLPAAGQDEPGQTPRPKATEPLRSPTEDELVRLPRDHEYFKFVEDEGPLLNRGKPIADPALGYAAKMELKAYDFVLAHARRQPVERLRQHSVKDVPFDNLFRPIKQDYLRELLHFEGRLALVLAMKPTDDLRDLEGVDQIYEAWITPRGSRHFACLVVTELPPGIKPGENQTANVAFDAYYLKLFYYESREPKDRADPDKKQWHKAPMFLGRSFDVTAPDEPATTYSPMMLAVVVSGLVALGLVALGMGLWFRRGDRRIQAGARERLHQSVTFDDITDAPAPVNRISDQF